MSDISPKNRLHIAIFGRKNAGKSSLLNALTCERTAVVSEEPGSTTEALFYRMDLDPVGPVVLIDTAGFEQDEHSELGQQRSRKLQEVMDQTDLALLLFTDTNEDYSLERRCYKELSNRHIPVLGVVNKIDDRFVDVEPIKIQFDEIPIVKISASNRINLNRVRQSIRRMTPIEFERSTIIGDLVSEKDLVLLVSPKDLKAPRYRLPTIHTQLIRDIMDQGAVSLTATEEELQVVLSYLSRKPDLVITESDVFETVCEAVPAGIPVTTYSILLARTKGELDVFIRGAKAIDSLKPGDRILVAEACGNHELKGDVTREKVPQWLKEKAGGELTFEVRAGNDFPADLTPYKLVLHCNSCAFNRKQLMARLTRSEAQHVPITNYGIALAHMNGVLERAIPQVVY
ncbi:MAG: small GTP-binding protein [Paenibacillaceae bacterium]|jgi:[FeFe] hydrogenase H-cluster maturation GTPase HydF|nr:small GTP-binding protein [Paenibacillaceae bacterium]